MSDIFYRTSCCGWLLKALCCFKLCLTIVHQYKTFCIWHKVAIRNTITALQHLVFSSSALLLNLLLHQVCSRTLGFALHLNESCRGDLLPAHTGQLYSIRAASLTNWVKNPQGGKLCLLVMCMMSSKCFCSVLRINSFNW